MASMIFGALLILGGGALIAANDYAASGFTLLLGTIFCIVGYEQRVGWDTRVEHLCRKCHATAQPSMTREGALNCSKCGSGDTVPIDSPFASALIKKELDQLERTLQ